MNNNHKPRWYEKGIIGCIFAVGVILLLLIRGIPKVLPLFIPRGFWALPSHKRKPIE